MKKLSMESLDILQGNIEKVERLFPNVITEVIGKNGEVRKAVHFERLKQELSGDIIEGEECYEFTWAGKKKAVAESNLPVRKTLRPCPEQSLDWFNTGNVYIDGDNLDVLKLLQKGYCGRIRMIYIDPPYNTGNNYIYNDNYSMDKEIYIEKTGLFSREKAQPHRLNASDGRFHSGWCSMLYPRLKLAWNLLTENGVMFISIDENELDNLKKICNELYGENAFITIIGLEITKTQGMKVKSAKEGSIVKNFEYVLCYAKNTSTKKIVKNILYDKNEGYDTHFSHYIVKQNGVYIREKLTDVLRSNTDIFNEFKKYELVGENGNISMAALGTAISVSEKIRNYIYRTLPKNIYQEMACDITLDGKTEEQLEPDRIIEYEDYLLTRTCGGKIRQYSALEETLYQNDEYKSEYGRVTIRGNLWKGFYSDMMNVAKEGEVEYKNGKKPVRLIRQLAKWIGVKDGDIIMDFFSGSATTAHAVMLLNTEIRGNINYIMVQMEENLDESLKKAVGQNKNNLRKTIHFLDRAKRPHDLCELGKERIVRVGENIKSDSKNTCMDIGFRVFKLDTSNMKEIYYALNGEDLKKNGSRSYAKEERNNLDLLFGAALDLGLPLSLKYVRKKLDGVTIYHVDEWNLIACFTEKLPSGVIRKIAEKQPAYVVYKNAIFADSLYEIGVEDIFKLYSPNTVLYGL